jgi:hypothetical protein
MQGPRKFSCSVGDEKFTITVYPENGGYRATCGKSSDNPIDQESHRIPTDKPLGTVNEAFEAAKQVLEDKYPQLKGAAW